MMHGSWNGGAAPRQSRGHHQPRASAWNEARLHALEEALDAVTRSTTTVENEGSMEQLANCAAALVERRQTLRRKEEDEEEETGGNAGRRTEEGSAVASRALVAALRLLAVLRDVSTVEVSARAAKFRLEARRAAMRVAAAALAAEAAPSPALATDAARSLARELVRSASSARSLAQHQHQQHLPELLRALRASLLVCGEATTKLAQADCVRLVPPLLACCVLSLPSATTAVNGPSAHHSASIPAAVSRAANGMTASSRYVPPAMRRRRRAGSSTADDDGGGSSSSEDSSSSDAEDSSGGGRGARLRFAAIQCIASLARAGGKNLHAAWSSLFPPSRDWMQQRPAAASAPHLLEALVRDPSARNRAAAAAAVSAILDGTDARAYVGMAAKPANPREAPRGFVTMFAGLGGVVEAIHTGLLHAVATDVDTGVRTASLHALAALATAAPYGRVNTALLVDLLRASVRSLEVRSGDEEHEVMVGRDIEQLESLRCIVNGLGSKKATVEVTSWLTSGDVDAPRLLVRFCDAAYAPQLRVEAMSAMHALCKQYFVVVRASSLDTIMDAVENVAVDASQQLAQSNGGESTAGAATAAVMDDRLFQQCLRVTTELLHGLCESKVDVAACDAVSDAPIPASLDALSKRSIDAMREHGDDHSTVDSRPAASVADADASCSSEEVIAFLSRAVNGPIRAAMEHPSPPVRTAGVTAIGALASPSASNDEVSPRFLAAEGASLARQLATISETDSAAPVRAAACKALGSLCRMRSVLVAINLHQMTRVCACALKDPSQAVRIAACWSLANISDGLRLADLEPTEASVLAVEIANESIAASALGDKVRCNAVRALGNASRVVDFRDARCIDEDTLRRIVDALLLSIRTGSAKSQWNACHALGLVLQNSSAGTGAELTWREEALSALLELIEASNNFKTRIHAAVSVSGRCFHVCARIIVPCHVVVRTYPRVVLLNELMRWMYKF